MPADRVAGIALLILAVFVIIETRVLPLGSHKVPGPGYLPMLLACFLGFLSILMIFLRKESPLFRSLKWPEGRHALAIVGCCFFATFAIENLGYRVTMMIVLGTLFGIIERMKLWQVIVLTLGLTFGSYCVFNNFLRVILPQGFWGI